MGRRVASSTAGGHQGQPKRVKAGKQDADKVQRTARSRASHPKPASNLAQAVDGAVSGKPVKKKGRSQAQRTHNQHVAAQRVQGKRIQAQARRAADAGSSKSSGQSSSRKGRDRSVQVQSAHPRRQPRIVTGSTGPTVVPASAHSSTPAQASHTRSAAGAFVDARALESSDRLFDPVLESSEQRLGVLVKPKVVDFKARIQERKRANLRSVALHWSLVVLVLALVAGCIWGMCWSPLLMLRENDISVAGGNEWVSNQEIFDIVKGEDGRSLVLVSSAHIEGKISALPGVTSAKVSKHFPHGMDVTFTSQKPAAVLKAADGTVTAVDQHGGVLNAVGASSKGIPLIEVTTLHQGVNDHAVQQALKILSALPEPMRQRVSKVSAKTQDSVTTELDDGQRIIIWGDASDVKLKMAVVDKIVNDPSKIGDKHQVDVSAPLRPIIK